MQMLSGLTGMVLTYYFLVLPRLQHLTLVLCQNLKSALDLQNLCILWVLMMYAWKISQMMLVYQGHHGDQSVYCANVILPAAAFSEKEGIYENTEGCAQQTLPAVLIVGDARDNWKIIRALSEVAGLPLPYDSLGAIRSRIRTVAPNLLNMDEREPATFSSLIKSKSSEKLTSDPFRVAIDNFNMTDAITRASKILAQCSALLPKK